MDQLPDLKALKKLADMCRKCGIKSFKSGAFEFTLSEDVPVSNYKKSKENNQVPLSMPNTSFQSDTLTEDELMFWSTGADIEKSE